LCAFGRARVSLLRNLTRLGVSLTQRAGVSMRFSA
jgi:hypothetical protein